MTLVVRVASAAALIAAMLLPAVAEAQEQRLSVSFIPAVASVGGEGEFGIASSAAYQFTRHFSFEGDFTWVDGAGLRDGRVFMAEPSLTDLIGRITGGMRNDPRNTRMPIFGGRTPIPISAILPGPASFDGTTMIGTLGVRYEPMAQTERFRPFLSAGVGLNFTDQDFRYESTAQRAGAALVDFEESFSHTGMAFSAGGGAGIRIVSSLWATADAKYFRLSRDRNLMRLGGGITLRF